ncbi:YbjN domain-containing protein [Parvularcula sp. LCG005]|uniref:YbjN domain-containing protein n=1 Tax=Parvularcula sp. LCG005 TaxID=3078805 RepID=UPI0029438FB7|nr:YbjN domain-containing protein [Parvularcula sp. LCG005]WOI54635.1 YbjN domain-containing protein [Parvularcula sp. LCG005]
MDTTVTTDETVFSDPLDTLEIMARRADMDTQRVDENELHINLTGSWRDVGIWVSWRAEAQVLQIAAPLEMRVPAARELEVLRLIVAVNERLWLGHFDLIEHERNVVYRNGAVLPEGQGMEDGQADIVLRAALDAFERFYPAFNYVVWGEKTASEALEAAICEVAGSA